MHVIADLQLHSRFSRAVSKEMTIPNISLWARRKGIGLIATGDWMHPLWMREIQESLEEQGNGLLKLKPSAISHQSTAESSSLKAEDPHFMLATEVSCIYTQGGKGRRVHTLIWVPSLASALKINQQMMKQGCNLMSDGRPIVGLSSINIAELVFTIEPNALIIPAHAWTPWFALYGSMSGFDSLEEAYGPYAKQIYAIETGLSSSPAMNWQIKELDTRSIVSFSDAHSGPKLGREATVFEISDQSTAVSYQHIYDAIRAPSLKAEDRKLQAKIAYTIEFYPEEGKYHYTGHRACNIRWTPEETRIKGTTCPVCGKPLTEGVMQRVGDLSGRSEADLKLVSVPQKIDASGVELMMIKSKTLPDRPPFAMMVPLVEIISESVHSSVSSQKVQTSYFKLIEAFGGEFNVLLKAKKEEIARVIGGVVGEKIAVGVEKVRTGDIVIDPGYDGVFGVVKLWKEGEEQKLVDTSREQLSIF